KQMQLGLPITPVTDLKVHHDDLLASTMGRAFWILDDIEVLRDFDQNNVEQFKLFTPSEVVRTSAYSAINSTVDVDEPSSPSPSFVGTNKASGAVIYYQLPNVLKDSVVTLDIMNSRNEVVRSYSSKDDEDFVGYAGGPDAEPKLPVRKGLNRFVWDLRGEPIKGVPTVFIEGSFDGYRVAPGTYTARLKANGLVQTTTFNVIPRPGLDFPVSDYADQEALMKRICEETSEIH
ncbi:MAG: glycosyl hydrolase, partial [bacterium]